MTDTDHCTVRRASGTDVAGAFALIDAEGWYLTLKKYHEAVKAFPGCFYVIVDSTGGVAGTVSFVATAPSVYNLGYMVIRSEVRGQGLGQRLVREAVKMFSYDAVVVTISPGLDAFYKSVGFKYTQVQHDHIFTIIDVSRSRVDERIQSERTKQKEKHQVITRSFEFETNAMDRLVAYEARARGYENNGRYIQALVNFAHCVVARRASGDEIVGFGGVYFNDRKQQLVIEGLFADSDLAALLIFRSLISMFPEENKVKLESLHKDCFLSQFGSVTSQATSRKYVIGAVQAEREEQLYNCTDCDFTW